MIQNIIESMDEPIMTFIQQVAEQLRGSQLSQECQEKVSTPAKKVAEFFRLHRIPSNHVFDDL